MRHTTSASNSLQLSVRISFEDAANLKRLADESGRPTADVMREAIIDAQEWFGLSGILAKEFDAEVKRLGINQRQYIVAFLEERALSLAKQRPEPKDKSKGKP